MNPEQIEQLERVTLSMVVQALKDYKGKAVAIFREETDKAQDIAEDITRESIEEMRLPRIDTRLYGKVDVKKAIYAFLPDAIPVALMLDAKAEKGDEGKARIQMSQTSMRVRMIRSGEPVDEGGLLGKTIERDGRTLQTVTVVAKYVYHDLESGFGLDKILVICIPNGQLQDKYNPNMTNTIWNAGPDSQTRGEDFRVRVNLKALKQIASWRVREIPCGQETSTQPNP